MRGGKASPKNPSRKHDETQKNPISNRHCITARKLLFVHGVRFAELLGIGGGLVPFGFSRPFRFFR
jgi:hypothetical protein